MADLRALRDIAANHGWPVCDEAADEIEDHEKAYALLFAENASLRAAMDRIRETVRHYMTEGLDADFAMREIASIFGITSGVDLPDGEQL